MQRAATSDQPSAIAAWKQGPRAERFVGALDESVRCTAARLAAVLSLTLRASVASVAGSYDYSYARPSRRRIPNVVLPGLRRPVPSVAIIVDTSASMDDDMLSQAFTEVNACFRSMGVARRHLSVYTFDTQAGRVVAPDATLLEVVGGGGTDIRVGFRAAMAHRPRPHIIVALTDGLTPWPERRPNAVTIVALIELQAGLDVATPSWARRIMVPCDAVGEREPT